MSCFTPVLINKDTCKMKDAKELNIDEQFTIFKCWLYHPKIDFALLPVYYNILGQLHTVAPVDDVLDNLNGNIIFNKSQL